MVEAAGAEGPANQTGEDLLEKGGSSRRASVFEARTGGVQPSRREGQTKGP